MNDDNAPLAADGAEAIAEAEAEIARGEPISHEVIEEFWRAQGV